MFGETLGQGAFGVVVKAEALGLTHKTEKQFVAVKMLKGIHSDVITLLCQFYIYPVTYEPCIGLISKGTPFESRPLLKQF